MKRKVYANVRMTVIRQVEFDVDVDTPRREVEDKALEVARREWGDFDEAEIEEMDWAENPPDMEETAVPDAPDLDEHGFVFIDKQQRPFWCCMVGGDPWVCYWHAEQMWVTLRRVSMGYVAEARTLAIPDEQAEIYHSLHRKHLAGTAVTPQEEPNGME